MTSRGVWVQDPQTGKLIPKHLYRRAPVARSHLPSPMVISDSLDGVWNPMDGRHYDSKSAYYRSVRQRGGEIIGNESPRVASPPPLPSAEADVAEALNIIESRKPSRPTRKRRKRV